VTDSRNAWNRLAQRSVASGVGRKELPDSWCPLRNSGVSVSCDDNIKGYFELEGRLGRETIESRYPPIKNIGVRFDSHHDSDRRTSEESGHSLGVQSKTPLHIVHAVIILEHVVTLTYRRVYMRRSVMGWGVSLWQFDVYGR
jgi:hypothetical protein